MGNINLDIVNATSDEEFENHIEKIIIFKSKKRIRFSLKVFVLKDGEYWVSYIPSLSISGYGKNKDDAHSMAKESLDDYFTNLFDLSMERIDKELSSQNWSKRRINNKEYSNTAHVDEQGVLRNLDLPEDTVIERMLIEQVA